MTAAAQSKSSPGGRSDSGGHSGDAADAKRRRPRKEPPADKTPNAGSPDADGSDAGTADKPAVNPWLIAVVVSIATFMEVLDTSIANVSLQHIAGSLSAGMDESTWVITSYLVANAVILPISGYAATMMGRKRFYMSCVALFTICSFMCGLSTNLTELIFFRVLQGIGGGGLAPSEQSILADSFKPSQRGKAFALYGLTVVAAPALGPTIGGWLTDRYSWHWIFLINVPIGVLSLVLVGLLVREPRATAKARDKIRKRGHGFDWMGFALVALGLGCLEVVMDKGDRDDWFSSNFILIMAVIAAVGILAMILWESQRPDPIVDIPLFKSKNFAACFVLMFFTGFALFGTVILMPQMLQGVMGYTALAAGEVLTPGGVATAMMMPVVGFLMSRVQPKRLMAIGLLALSFGLYQSTSVNTNASFDYFVYFRVLQAVGLPLLFVPITTLTYVGLPPDKSNNAAALINVARNMGGSVGVALCTTIVTHRTQWHQSRLVENATYTSPALHDYVSRTAGLFGGLADNAMADLASNGRALAALYQMLQQQAAMLAYVDVFFALCVVSLLIVPLTLLLGKVDKDGQASAAH